MAVKQITVFNIAFKSITEILQLIGYKSNLSLNRIKEAHGSLEAFIKLKLCVTSDSEAYDILMRLKKSNQQIELKNDDIVVKAVKNLAINKFIFSETADRDIESILKMYSDQRSTDEIKRLLLNES